MGNGGMAGFSNMSEDDYEALSFPSTPPPYRAAMELAAKFGEIDLGSAASAAGPLVCEGCQSPIGHRQRVLSLDETDEMKVDGEESKEESKGDDEEVSEKVEVKRRLILTPHPAVKSGEVMSHWSLHLRGSNIL